MQKASSLNWCVLEIWDTLRTQSNVSVLCFIVASLWLRSPS
nr:MAG TPA: hypothetical protein [Caudoviricetes sp.]